MADPTIPDHLATVRAALSSPIGGSCRCHLNGPGDFEVCHSCEGLGHALRNAAPAIAALADECERLRAALRTISVWLYDQEAKS